MSEKKYVNLSHDRNVMKPPIRKEYEDDPKTGPIPDWLKHNRKQEILAKPYGPVTSSKPSWLVEHEVAGITKPKPLPGPKKP